VTGRQRGDLARSGVELGTVRGPDAQRARHVILEVRCLAEFGPRDRLYVLRPAPAGLEDESADLAVADPQQLKPAVIERAHLIG
jgi:hypothetical protein